MKVLLSLELLVIFVKTILQKFLKRNTVIFIYNKQQIKTKNIFGYKCK